MNEENFVFFNNFATAILNNVDMFVNLDDCYFDVFDPIQELLRNKGSKDSEDLAANILDIIDSFASIDVGYNDLFNMTKDTIDDYIKEEPI